MKGITGSRKGGYTRIELILTVVGLLALTGILIFAVTDTRRRARDTERISTIRQLQFDLLAYRNRNASYPESIEALYGSTGAEIPYESLPEGCREDGETLCTGYRIALELEGRVGLLPGGVCEVSPDGITCSP